MRLYSRSILPDCVTGAVFAAEGIDGALTLLNGPTGCRFYHSTTSQFLRVRPRLYVPREDGTREPVDYNYLNSFFFRQQRVPCTYLDGHDYTYGTGGKVREALVFMREHISFGSLFIINAPGAALIGDDIRAIAAETLPGVPCAALESPGYSTGFADGYEAAAMAAVAQLPRGRARSAGGAKTGGAPTVNVLGLSIFDRYFEGDRAEIERALVSCGLRAGCFLCAGCAPGDIEALPDAALNFVLDRQKGLNTARMLEEMYGTPYFAPDSPPIGPEAAEETLRGLCAALGREAPEAALEECGRARALLWHKINQTHTTTGLPTGVKYAVDGSSTQLLAYSRFLTDYLGMTPDALSLTGRPDAPVMDALRERLAASGEEAALEREILGTEAELVFADANVIASLMTARSGFCGIEINLPGMGYTDIVPKTHLFAGGSLFLTEQVLNGLMSRL